MMEMHARACASARTHTLYLLYYICSLTFLCLDRQILIIVLQLPTVFNAVQAVA